MKVDHNVALIGHLFTQQTFPHDKPVVFVLSEDIWIVVNEIFIESDYLA